MSPRRDRGGVDGVLVVDKPSGMTSHDVVARVRRAFGQSRVGHTGTLDPSATGVLVVCLGRATKLARFLQASSKTYAARMVLGIETDTQDADGVIVARLPADHVDEHTFCGALTAFQGTYEQLPPMVSAVQVGGERLHQKARRGEIVERPTRTVEIEALVLDAFEPGQHPEASFLVTCSPGTYIRTLAHDVGRRLGVGGSLVELRRLANGGFGVDEAHELEDVEQRAPADVDGMVVDVVSALTRVMDTVEIDDPDLLARLVHGGTMPATGKSGPFAVIAGGALVGVYSDDHDLARAEFVWMRPEQLV